MLLRLLENDPDPLAKGARSIGRVVAENSDVAAVAAAVALQDLDRRRLARAVRPEQAEHLAGPHLEADAAERLDSVVRLGQVRYDDRIGHI